MYKVMNYVIVALIDLKLILISNVNDEIKRRDET